MTSRKFISQSALDDIWSQHAVCPKYSYRRTIGRRVGLSEATIARIIQQDVRTVDQLASMDKWPTSSRKPRNENGLVHPTPPHPMARDIDRLRAMGWSVAAIAKQLCTGEVGVAEHLRVPWKGNGT